jgi:uncharacterized protein (TIGR01777 family)
MIGSALVHSLRTDGIQVVRLVRRTPIRPDESFWDPSAGTIEAGRLEGIDGAVHLAGENLGGGLWTEARKQRIRESRVQGTSLLAATLANLSHRPRVLVSASAIGYYGDRGDAVVTETDPGGHGFLAEVCRVWEASADAARQAGIRVAHPRFGVVIHPKGGMLAKLLLPFRLGLGAQLGSGAQWLSWTTLGDVVAAIRFLLEHDVHGSVNVTAPVPVTNREFTSTLAAALHRPALMAIPRVVLELVLGDLAREALLFSTRAIPGRLSELGFRFQDPELGPALETLLQRKT